MVIYLLLNFHWKYFHLTLRCCYTSVCMSVCPCVSVIVCVPIYFLLFRGIGYKSIRFNSQTSKFWIANFIAWFGGRWGRFQTFWFGERHYFVLLVVVGGERIFYILMPNPCIYRIKTIFVEPQKYSSIHRKINIKHIRRNLRNTYFNELWLIYSIMFLL